MLELRPAAVEPAVPAAGPRTARDAVGIIEAELARILDDARRRARATDAVFAREVADRVSALVRRGGKRLRAAFVWCGWQVAGGEGDLAAVVRTGAALELIQACALIHDDVMDGSATRRGAPAVHVDFARMHRDARMAGPPRAFASSAAVLAGDLALAWADDLLTETALGSPHGIRLHREWQAMRTEMVAGQYRDVRALAATGASELDEALSIATLKSALYTVERPLALGASLSGADAATLAALRSAGRCAGLAFQLRDDLRGAFADPARTGKPVDDDLRTRKSTYLLAVGRRLADAAGDTDAVEALAAGTAPASPEELRTMRAALERTGARAAVESKISELAAAGLRHFERTGARPFVRREFAALVTQASGAAPARSGEAACER
ncbi:polyprenyl synthetase family protein [Streptomyces sp. B8F3]|uniref:polyprenyl synthetase family protein n=1 Tax=unclassified Streptomyces TaxID=2593676 RepID=UPI00325F6C2A